MGLDIEQVPLEDIIGQGKIDLFIIALGHESRASYLASKMDSLKISSKYCIQLVKNPNQKEKEKIQKMGFTFLERSNLDKILDASFDVIVVDYSVMMKSLYAEILTILHNSRKLIHTKIFFSYSHAIFEKALERSRYVESIKPILLTDDKLLQDVSKTKLIISLGYERLSAIGIIENLEISYNDVIILINKETEASEHYHECLRVNEEFLVLLDPSQIIEVNFYNTNQLTAILSSVLFSLSQQNYRVIISPMSVKTFSLYAMVYSLKYSNVFFYNVTSINSEPHYKKEVNTDKPPLVYLITKTNSNDETKIL